MISLDYLEKHDFYTLRNASIAKSDHIIVENIFTKSIHVISIDIFQFSPIYQRIIVPLIRVGCNIAQKYSR